MKERERRETKDAFILLSMHTTTATLHLQRFCVQRSHGRLQDLIPVPRLQEDLHLHPLLILALPQLTQFHLLPQDAEVIAVQRSQFAVKQVTRWLEKYQLDYITSLSKYFIG